MKNTAFFVDSGYLFAQGSSLITGKKQKRPNIDIDIEAFKNELFNLRPKIGVPGILRIYWYDAASPGELTGQQRAIGETSSIKLRLGTFNNQGHQKGVDSLIVTDLLELARNGAIGDAVVLAGDEDIRIGVSMAQSLGVRVHLLGISPARVSQSLHLRMEADTCFEWDKGPVGNFLSVRQRPQALKDGIENTKSILSEDLTESMLHLAVCGALALIRAESVNIQRSMLEEDSSSNLNSDVDRPMIKTLGDKIGRELNSSERSRVRALAKRIILA